MRTAGRILVFLLLAIVVVVLFFTNVQPGQTNDEKTRVRNDEAVLVTAIKAFYAEYGLLPKTSAECVPADGRLMAILKGEDHLINPRKIVFIELPIARKKNGLWRTGLHPETGAFLDPYGHPYLVKLDTDYDEIISNPYSDPKAAEQKLRQTAIVWSSGKDGVFGNPKARGQFQGSDDVLSWR